MALFRAEAVGLNLAKYKDLVRNPLMRFGETFAGDERRPGMFISWQTNDFDQEMVSTSAVLEAGEHWLKEIISEKLDWAVGPQIELWADAQSSYVLSPRLLQLAETWGWSFTSAFPNSKIQISWKSLSSGSNARAWPGLDARDTHLCLEKTVHELDAAASEL